MERLATTNAGFGFTRLYDVRWYKPKLTVRVKHLAASNASTRHGENALMELYLIFPSKCP